MWSFEIKLFGAIAQLGERLNGIQEVWGSTPHSSIFNKKRRIMQNLLPYLIVLFVMLVVFLILRQTSQKGKRTGREKRLKILKRMQDREDESGKRGK